MESLAHQRPLTLALIASAYRRGKRFVGGLGMIASSILLLLILMSFFPHLFAIDAPDSMNIGLRLQPPSMSRPFGTDEFGRDMFSRVVYGTRISFGTATVVVGVSGLIGTSLGLLGGAFGGWMDDAIMRIADLFIAFPVLIIAMSIVALIGPGLTNAMVALIVVWWPQYARLARAQVIGEKGKAYVEAARALGRSELSILRHHILRNAWAPVMIKATLDMGVAILYTAGLSFMGLGARPPSPEWGALITQGRQYLVIAWWYPTFPGLAMFLAVFSVNLLGDSLRDAFDPTLRVRARNR